MKQISVELDIQIPDAGIDRAHPVRNPRNSVVSGAVRQILWVRPLWDIRQKFLHIWRNLRESSKFRKTYINEELTWTSYIPCFQKTPRPQKDETSPRPGPTMVQFCTAGVTLKRPSGYSIPFISHTIRKPMYPSPLVSRPIRHLECNALTYSLPVLLAIDRKSFRSIVVLRVYCIVYSFSLYLDYIWSLSNTETISARLLGI